MSNKSARVAVTVANHTVGFGGRLECLNCGAKRNINKVDIIKYYRSGWPKCHGQTMRWKTARELAQEATDDQA